MPAKTYPAAWGLTPLETAYLNALRPGKLVSAADLEKLHAGPVTKASRRIQKTIAQLRRKLDPHNVEIETKWGQGWQIGQAGRSRLTGLLNGST